jgi:hypothetical protein
MHAYWFFFFLERSRKKQRSKEDRPQVAVNFRPVHLPGGRKPGKRHPLFALGPASQTPGPAQLQVGPESKSNTSDLMPFLCVFVVNTFASTGDETGA